MSARAPERRPTVHIITIGCPKNEVDSDRMAASLARSFTVAPDPDSADVIVVNTCAFIAEATEESVAVVLESASWKAEKEGRVLVVAGCMPSRYRDELASLLPEADAFVPVADEASIARVVASLTGHGTAVPRPEHAGRTQPGPSAYLQVSDGCHRSCSFCTIPTIRGDHVSRPFDEIVAEARWLVAHGAKELVLVGQDVSAWGTDLLGQQTLADLVRRLAATDGLAWLRLMYVQPDGLTPDLLEAMAESPAVCRYLDIPLQHASKPILRAMHRRGDAAEFARLMGTVRGLLPGVFLRSTFIAGFPGESRHDAEILERFLRDASLDYAGVFPFSPEEGTVAAALPGQVPPRTRRARTQRLRDIADEIGFDRAAQLVGRRLEVLVTGPEDDVCVGRHRGQAPEVDGIVALDRDIAAGQIVEVEIVDALGYDLVGEVV